MCEWVRMGANNVWVQKPIHSFFFMSRGRHTDFRLLPSISPSPSSRNLSSQDRLLSWLAQGIPGALRNEHRTPIENRPASDSRMELPETGNELTSLGTAPDLIAQALGLDSGRMLQFPSPARSRKSSVDDSDLALRFLALSISGRNSPINLGDEESPTVSRQVVVREIREIQYLVTYGLINNFYFNLVSWSHARNEIAVAIENEAYWWDGGGSIERLKDSERILSSAITCLECSSHDLMAVATVNSALLTFSQTSGKSIDCLVLVSPIQCIKWFSCGMRFFAGDLTGVVYYVEVGKSMEVVSSFGRFTQQICGTMPTNPKLIFY